jgi:hypothetical protein
MVPTTGVLCVKQNVDTMSHRALGGYIKVYTGEGNRSSPRRSRKQHEFRISPRSSLPINFFRIFVGAKERNKEKDNHLAK